MVKRKLGDGDIEEFNYPNKSQRNFSSDERLKFLKKAIEKDDIGLLQDCELNESDCNIKFSVKEFKFQINLIHYAAMKGAVKSMRYIADKISSIKNYQPFFSLYLASANGQIEVMKYLIDEEKLDVNTVDKNGITILFVAAAHGQIELMKYLIDEKKADVNIEDKNRMTLLHFAAAKGHIEVVKYLIDEKKLDANKGVKDDCSALVKAAANGHINIVKYLIVEKNVVVKTEDSWGYPALHVAAANGHFDIVKYLIDGKEVDVIDGDCRSHEALYEAAANGHLNIVKYLIDREEADVIIKGKIYEALHVAAANGYINIVKYLIDEKNVDVKPYDGDTALHEAASGGHIEVMKYLVNEKKVNVNMVASDNLTVLDLAVEKDQTEAVKFLLNTHKINYSAIKPTSLDMNIIKIANSFHHSHNDGQALFSLITSQEDLDFLKEHIESYLISKANLTNVKVENFIKALSLNYTTNLSDDLKQRSADYNNMLSKVQEDLNKKILEAHDSLKSLEYLICDHFYHKKDLSNTDLISRENEIEDLKHQLSIEGDKIRKKDLEGKILKLEVAILDEAADKDKLSLEGLKGNEKLGDGDILNLFITKTFIPHMDQLYVKLQSIFEEFNILFNQAILIMDNGFILKIKDFIAKVDSIITSPEHLIICNLNVQMQKQAHIIKEQEIKIEGQAHIIKEQAQKTKQLEEASQTYHKVLNQLIEKSANGETDFSSLAKLLPQPQDEAPSQYYSSSTETDMEVSGDLASEGTIL